MFRGDNFPYKGDRMCYYPGVNEFPNAEDSMYPAIVVRATGMEDPTTMRRLVDLMVFTEVGMFIKTNVQTYHVGETIPTGCCTLKPEDALRDYRYPI